MEIVIRKATVKDSRLIAGLSVKTFYETYAAYNTMEDMEKYTDSHFRESQVRKEIKEKIQTYFLCYCNETAAGYATLRNQNHPVELTGVKAAEIGRIYVSNEYKSRGIGRALIQQCAETAFMEGFDQLWLGVWQENLAAIAFYEKNGFSRLGVQTFLLGNDLQYDWIMSKPLK